MRTAALYKELIHGWNIADQDPQTDSDEQENRFGITEIAWTPALEYDSDENADQTLGTNEIHEKETLDISHQHQSPISNEDCQLIEKNTHEQFNRNEWNKEELTGDHRTLPSTSSESITGEIFPSAEATALDCENTLEDSEKIQESASVSQNETTERSLNLTIDSTNDVPESSQCLTTDTETQVSEDNDCSFESASRNILNSPILKHWKKIEDKDDYKCHLFAKSCYNISVTDKIYQHTLPKRVTLITTGTLVTSKDKDLDKRNIQTAHATEEDPLALEYKSSPMLITLNCSSEVKEVKKIAIGHSSSLGSFGSEPQHVTLDGEIRKRSKSVPPKHLAPKAKQSVCYQINIEASGGSEVTDSSECLNRPKKVSETLRSFRINKNLHSCRSQKETSTEKSSSLIVKAVDKRKSCIIIDLQEQDKLENIREAKDGIILPNHQRNETSHLRAYRTHNTLPGISDGNQGVENSSTVLPNADGPFKGDSPGKNNREASRSKVHITPHPNTEHTYSSNRETLPYKRKTTQASGSSTVLQHYRASKITPETEALKKMQNDRNISVNPIVSYHKSSTPEAPSLTKDLVKSNVMADDEVSEGANTHCITQDFLPVQKPANSLSRENKTDKFCSGQTSDTPVMSEHVEAQQASSEEPLNMIQSNLKPTVSAVTLGSSDTSTTVQNCLKNTTSMDSSVEQSELNSGCITQDGKAASMAELSGTSEVNHNFERLSVNENHGMSSAILNTVTEENNTNSPDITKAVEHTRTDEQYGTSEASCSSEDSTVIQNLTSSTSANLIPGTSLTNQEGTDRYVSILQYCD